MDLGISGRKAIVCASSKGLGKASALALAKEGVEVWICGRHREALDAATDEISAAGSAGVHAVVADITTDEGREALLASCYQQCLQLASKHNITSIAFPAISCGVYGYPIAQACHIAVREVRKAARVHTTINKVIFACFNADIAYHYRRELAQA